MGATAALFILHLVPVAPLDFRHPGFVSLSIIFAKHDSCAVSFPWQQSRPQSSKQTLPIENSMRNATREGNRTSHHGETDANPLRCNHDKLARCCPQPFWCRCHLAATMCPDILCCAVAGVTAVLSSLPLENSEQRMITDEEDQSHIDILMYEGQPESGTEPRRSFHLGTTQLFWRKHPLVNTFLTANDAIAAQDLPGV